jgi:hypothetical protein
MEALRPPPKCGFLQDPHDVTSRIRHSSDLSSSAVYGTQILPHMMETIPRYMTSLYALQAYFLRVYFNIIRRLCLCPRSHLYLQPFLANPSSSARLLCYIARKAEYDAGLSLHPTFISAPFANTLITRKMAPSATLLRMALVRTDVSEKRSASFIRVFLRSVRRLLSQLALFLVHRFLSP